MTLRVTPGPVPADGTRIIIAEAMGDFIRGTRFTNFGPDEFVGEPIDFIISATEPPATDVRTRATLWFARGQGKLYRWTYEPQKSEFWAPSEAASNTGSDAHWLAISDRRDMLVKSRWSWNAFERVRVNSAFSEWKMEQSVDIAGEPRFTLVCTSTANTDAAAGGGMGWEDARFMGVHNHIDPFFVALTTAATNSYAPVCDVGFCDAYVRGPGPTGDEVQFAWHMSNGDPHLAFSATYATGWTNTSAILGVVVGSAPSNAMALRQVFVFASSTNMVKATGSALFS